MSRADAVEPLLQDTEKALARRAQADSDFEETDTETRRLADLWLLSVPLQ